MIKTKEKKKHGLSFVSSGRTSIGWKDLRQQPYPPNPFPRSLQAAIHVNVPYSGYSEPRPRALPLSLLSRPSPLYQPLPYLFCRNYKRSQLKRMSLNALAPTFDCIRQARDNASDNYRVTSVLAPLFVVICSFTPRQPTNFRPIPRATLSFPLAFPFSLSGAGLGKRWGMIFVVWNEMYVHIYRSGKVSTIKCLFLIFHL